MLNSYNEDKAAGYYVGNIIVHDNGDKVNGNILKFELVDGQQRLTTFALILLAIYCLSLSKKFTPTDDTIILKIKESLWKYINRSYSNENRTVCLNSIEKTAFKDLYDYCYAGNANYNVLRYCESYKKKNKFEEQIFSNFLDIYSFLNDKICAKNKNEEILNFADFILQSVQFIVIESTCKPNKVFSMFESINSKEKNLMKLT